jgi:hypothetical protein
VFAVRFAHPNTFGTSQTRKTLYAIRKPASAGAEGDRKFMTLLPSFNGNETQTKCEIPTNRDYLITTVKRLRNTKTKIFNNHGEVELYSANRIVNSFLEDVNDIKRRRKILIAFGLIDLIICHRKGHYAFASRIIREDMRDEIHTCQ